ncbi:hypothetical protein AaE_010146 [Aphanomyces astaci]|uniref:Uncharacterized protein n=1 Tax=Aphanomyces astaci TaxID=112090 RepID=A0A6A5A8I8_APHAT|nr:hypothetical protein AaE_010146 [Aphanomyces astaci]
MAFAGESTTSVDGHADSPSSNKWLVGGPAAERRSPGAGTKVMLKPSQTLRPALRKLRQLRGSPSTSPLPMRSLCDRSADAVIPSFHQSILDFNALIDADLEEHVSASTQFKSPQPPTPHRANITRLSSQFFLQDSPHPHDDPPCGWNPFANSFSITRNA